MAGGDVFNSSQNSSSTWTPTILYLFVLILVEMFVFAIIGRHI